MLGGMAPPMPQSVGIPASAVGMPPVPGIPPNMAGMPPPMGFPPMIPPFSMPPPGFPAFKAVSNSCGYFLCIIILKES